MLSRNLLRQLIQVKKQQIILSIAGIALLLVFLFFGKTTPSGNITKSDLKQIMQDSFIVLTSDILQQAKKNLSVQQLQHIETLEDNIIKGNKKQEITLYDELNHYWRDSLNQPVIGAYYHGKAAILENSEKSLTFAARFLLDEMMVSTDASMQSWLAIQAKELLEKSLVLNPSNDSSKIGIAACYIFGNISDNPMQGILTLKQTAEKTPDNLYAQMMLGLAGIKSGQYDKAIEHLLIVVQKQPNNLEAVLNLAEAYDRKADKTNAVKWYKIAKQLINVPDAKNEIDKRIQLLQ